MSTDDRRQILNMSFTTYDPPNPSSNVSLTPQFCTNVPPQLLCTNAVGIVTPSVNSKHDRMVPGYTWRQIRRSGAELTGLPPAAVDFAGAHFKRAPRAAFHPRACQAFRLIVPTPYPSPSFSAVLCKYCAVRKSRCRRAEQQRSTGKCPITGCHWRGALVIVMRQVKQSRSHSARQQTYNHVAKLSRSSFSLIGTSGNFETSSRCVLLCRCPQTQKIRHTIYPH